MKLNELIGARYGCSFPARLNKPAIAYYKEHSEKYRCYFFLEEMVETNDFNVHPDAIRYMAETASEGFSELFEAFLYAACEDFKKNKKKQKNFVIILDDE